MPNELTDVYVIRLNERLATIGIKAELVAQREWQGATHYAVDLRRGNGKAYRFRDWIDLSSIAAMVATGQFTPEDAIRHWQRPQAVISNG